MDRLAVGHPATQTDAGDSVDCLQTQLYATNLHLLSNTTLEFLCCLVLCDIYNYIYVIICILCLTLLSPPEPARIRTPTNIQVTSNSLTVQVVPTPTGNFNISAYCAIFNQEMVSGNRVNVQRRICNTTMEVTYENAPEDTVIRIFALICNNVNICGLTSFSTVRKTLPTRKS